MYIYSYFSYIICNRKIHFYELGCIAVHFIIINFIFYYYSPSFLFNSLLICNNAVSYVIPLVFVFIFNER